MPSIGLSVLRLIFVMLRRASVESLSCDERTELMRLVRSLSMSASEGAALRADLRRLSAVLDRSEIFHTGTIEKEETRAAATIGQLVMLRLSEEEPSAEIETVSP